MAAGGGAAAAFDPLSSITWHSAYWAEDPDWTNPGDGNAVTSWRDGSGNGRTLTPPGTGPIYTASTSGMNNRPALTYSSAVNRRLTSASFTTLAQTFSLVQICRYNSTGAHRTFDNSGIGTGRVIAATSGGGAYLVFNGSVITPAPPAPGTARELDVFKFAGASSWVEANGTRSSTFNPGTAGLGGIGIGSDGASAHFTGDIAFVGVYAGDVTADAKWADFETWCSDLYSITIA